jgi:hypothetical protein
MKFSGFEIMGMRNGKLEYILQLMDDDKRGGLVASIHLSPGHL